MASTVVPEVPSVESVGTGTIKQAVYSTFLCTYQQSLITQAPEGLYIAKFPWKEDKPFLPLNIAVYKR